MLKSSALPFFGNIYIFKVFVTFDSWDNRGSIVLCNLFNVFINVSVSLYSCSRAKQNWTCVDTKKVLIFM